MNMGFRGSSETEVSTRSVSRRGFVGWWMIVGWWKIVGWWRIFGRYWKVVVTGGFVITGPFAMFWPWRKQHLVSTHNRMRRCIQPSTWEYWAKNAQYRKINDLILSILIRTPLYTSGQTMLLKKDGQHNLQESNQITLLERMHLYYKIVVCDVS